MSASLIFPGAGMMPRATGRSDAMRLRRTAPAAFLFQVLPISANEVYRRHPDGPTTQTGEEPGYFLMRFVRYEKRIRGWSPYLTRWQGRWLYDPAGLATLFFPSVRAPGETMRGRDGRQGCSSHVAGLAAFVLSFGFLLWLTCAAGPP